MNGRIAVAVSGGGSNLRALVDAARRGTLGGDVALVVADRACPALDWAAEQEIDTALVPGGDDATLVDALDAARPDVVVLAGYMRIIGSRVLAAYPGRILNIHPSLLPAFPGAHAVRDALLHGARVTGATVHVVDATLDGGPIVAQEAVAIVEGDDEATLHRRIKAVEHRLLPATVARILGERPTAANEVPVQPPATRRALLSVSDKAGLDELGRALVELRFELVSTGGTARALRDAGLPVTDVAGVTGAPEMLDGRVKTLHPRIHAGILADLRLADHRRQLAVAGIEPFGLVVVNLYPFSAAAERPGITPGELIEEIDIGGPAMVRAAAKNHANVAVVTSPGQYAAVLGAIREHGAVPDDLRRALAVEAFRHTAAYDARIAEVLPARLGVGADGGDPFPETLTVTLEKVESLRYGENPHQPAARYRRPGATVADGPFATGDAPLQGKALSYNNVLDGSAAAAVARVLRGPACVIVKHTNPCGAAERATLREAWEAALAGDPVSAFGGVVALTRTVDRATAEGLASLFLEIVVAPGFDDEARAILAGRTSLRLVLDPMLGAEGTTAPPPDPLGSIRTAGGAVLVTALDTAPDDPATWTVATRRGPRAAEHRNLDLAWRLVRGVTSNAIVLVSDGRLIGLGSGQTSRVDAARQAVEKARALSGPHSLVGAACASDAFYPFPDAIEACLAAGVTAFIQPGGSKNDADAIAAVDAAGATMLLTGVRHFRH